MRHYGDSVKDSSKTQNEDLHFDQQTRYGDFCLVLDFAGHTYDNLNLKLRGAMGNLLTALSDRDGMTAEVFLGYFAKELNNYVYRVGQEFCAGRLYCVAAMCLLKGNRLTYLTYGDARINLFNGSDLILLNGAKFQVPIILTDVQEKPKPIDENPEQFGLRYFHSALVERAYTISVGDSDTILMFSDGVEDGLSAPERLRELRRLKLAEPSEIYNAIMQATTTVQDDRTLVVMKGSYQNLEEHSGKLVQQNIESLNSRLLEIEKVNPAPRDELTLQAETIKNQIAGMNSTLSELTKLIDVKADSKWMTEELKKVQNIEQRTLVLENKGGAKKQRKSSADDPLDKDTFKRVFDDVVATDPTWWSNHVEPANSRQLEVSQNGGTVTVYRANSAAPAGASPEEGFRMSRLGLSATMATVGVLLGVLLGWLVGVGGNSRTRENWQVKTKENILTLRLTDEAGRIDQIDIPLVRLSAGVRGIERDLTSFRQVADFLHSSGVLRTGGEGNDSKPDPPVLSTIEVFILKGDSLERLAARHKITKEQILELNPNLKDNALVAGQKLRVPIESAVPESK